MHPMPVNHTVRDCTSPSQPSAISLVRQPTMAWNCRSIAYRKCFERQDWRAAAQYAKPVLLRLLVEHEPARQRHNASFDALRPELARRLESDADLRARGHDRQLFGLLLMHDIAALRGLLDRRILEVWQVLSREGENRRCLRRLECDEIGGRGLVTIRGSPERKIWGCTEVDCRLNGLVCGAILTKTNGIVSC